MTGAYWLGVDIGTARVAAATCRATPDGSFVVSPVPLGYRTDSAPAVAFVASDGELLFGDTAERRGLMEPERLVVEFKSAIGDDVPFSVGGHRVEACYLFARTVASVVEKLRVREGEMPAGVTVTHPASWGPHRTKLVRAALAEVGLGVVELMTEPEAAAHNHEATHPVDPGGVIAVFRFGGTSFDVSVMRKEQDGAFALLGNGPVGEDLGGTDFDDLVLRHALSSSGADPLDLSGDDVRVVLTQLRRDCVDAKEALSFDSEATIPVLLPPAPTKIRLTRAEFESMIEAPLERAVAAVGDALEGAGVKPADVDALVLVGGSSRIPRVAECLSTVFDRPITIDPDPKGSVAQGAARDGLRRSQRPTLPDVEVAVPPVVPTRRTGLRAIKLIPRRTRRSRDGAASPRRKRRWPSTLALGVLSLLGVLLIGSPMVSDVRADVVEAVTASKGNASARPTDGASGTAMPGTSAAATPASTPAATRTTQLLPATASTSTQYVMLVTVTPSPSATVTSTASQTPQPSATPTATSQPSPSPSPTATSTSVAPTATPTTSEPAPAVSEDPPATSTPETSSLADPASA